MALFKDKYRIESSRLKGWDYRNPGYYFVTICTGGRKHYFGHIARGDMYLLPIGEIAAQYWHGIPEHHTGIELDEFVVMPNHIHGIIVIRGNVETFHGTSLPTTGKPTMSEISPKAGSLGIVMRSYKSAVSRWAGLNGHTDFAWQTRYHDHVIRDENSLDKIRQYIVNNPARLDLDRENPANLYM